MKIYILLGVVGLVILVVALNYITAYFELLRHKIIVAWDERHAEEKEKQLEKEKRKLAEAFSEVYVGNPYLEMILKQYNIIVYGALGAGKTLFANLLCYYLNLKYYLVDRKNRLYNKYMNPEYEKELLTLQEKNLLRVYSNIPLADEFGNKSQELWPYLTQEKRFIEKGIVFTDEFGTSLGKDLYYSQAKNTIEVERIVEMSRFARQNREIKWIGTEQSRDNIFKPIRDRGFTEVQALKTFVNLSKWGKIKRRVLSICRMALPAYFTVNWKKAFQKTLFTADKIKLGLKLLCPAFCFCKREYFIAKTETNKKIKDKYNVFTVIIDFYGNEMLFKFKNDQIFKYNTRQNKDAYLKQFNKEGDRIHA